MSNPVAGQDFLVNMITDEDLTNYQSITIEYKKPDGTIVTGVVPTLVVESTGTISYLLQDTITVEGIWHIGAKVIDAAGNVSFINPPICVQFENKLRHC